MLHLQKKQHPGKSTALFTSGLFQNSFLPEQKERQRPQWHAEHQAEQDAPDWRVAVFRRFAGGTAIMVLACLRQGNALK